MMVLHHLLAITDGSTLFLFYICLGMKKIFATVLFTGIALLALFSFLFWKRNKYKIPYAHFSEWYAANYGNPKNGNAISPHVYTYECTSAALTIDTIFRSMQGPLAVQMLRFDEEIGRAHV